MTFLCLFYVLNAFCKARWITFCVWNAPTLPRLHWKWMWAGYKWLCMERLYSVHTAVFPSTGDSVLTSSSFWGICWHIQSTVPSQWPHFHRGCSIHLCYCYLFSLGLCRFIELLICIILAWGRKAHASHFKRFGINLHAYFSRLLESSHQFFYTDQAAAIALDQFHHKQHTLRSQGKPCGQDHAQKIHSEHLLTYSTEERNVCSHM